MAGIFWSAFDKTKLRSHLLMGLERFKLLNNRRRNEMQTEKREIGTLLRDKQYDRARIKVESVIRKDKERQASEMLETMCDLIATRITLIATEKTCAVDLQESVQTVMWASKRLPVDELHEVRNQLTMKYGDVFAAAAMKGEGAGCHVNARVRELLTVGVPADDVKIHYLTEIATAQGVSFDPKEMAKGGLLPAMTTTGSGPSGLGPAPSTDLPCCGSGADSDSDDDHHKPTGGSGTGGAGSGGGVAAGGAALSGGGGTTATVITGADGSTTIVLAPTGSIVTPTGGATAAGSAVLPGPGGYLPSTAATAAAGLPAGVILDPFSAAAAAGGMGGMGGPYGGTAVGGGGGGMMMPVFPYGYGPAPPMVDPAAAHAAAFPDGLPPHLRGAVASPGYSYGAPPPPASAAAGGGAPLAPASTSAAPAAAAAARHHGVFNPEDEEGDASASGSHHHGARASMAPVHTSGAAAAAASHSDVPSKAASSGGGAASGGAAPSIDDLAARFAALKASRGAE